MTLICFVILSTGQYFICDKKRHKIKSTLIDSNGFHILNSKWDEVNLIFIASLWLLITLISKILISKLNSEKIAESAVQIIIGVFFAIIFWLIDLPAQYYQFNAHSFFAFLLPPIIFDAGLFIPNSEFFNNFDSIMMFAVMGTVFNTFAIGISLSMLNYFGLFGDSMNTSEIMMFSSLISAVDPVAVIAVFEEIGVNKPLFVNVFGEALFNDAISVVLFGIFKSFALAADKVQNIDYLYGVLAFFLVSLGGAFIGILFAGIATIFAKFSKNLTISPGVVLLISYLGYIVSEICSFSSIIAIAVTGMVLQNYLSFILPEKSLQSLQVMTRNLALCSESLTFILLGLAIISIPQNWHTSFVIFTIIFCLLFRTVAIFGLSRIIPNKQILLKEQIIISFSGLRGAIAFGVVLTIPDQMPAKSIFATTTLAVIFFSVIVQGCLIRPLLKLLRIELDTSEESSESQNMEMAVPNIMSFVEVVAGRTGMNRIRLNFDNFNDKFILPCLK